MDIAVTKCLDIITAQQQNNKNNPAYWVGEQIKDICKADTRAAEIVAQDLREQDKSIKKCEEKIRDYARKHGGCTPPQAADEIIREFYGLPKANEQPGTPAGVNIDLANLW